MNPSYTLTSQEIPYFKRLLELNPELKTNTAIYKVMKSTLERVPDDDFLHSYFEFIFGLSNKELNFICKYMNMKGLQNHKKNNKVNYITMKINERTNFQIDNYLLSDFMNIHKLFDVKRWTERRGSLDYFNEFIKFETAFAERFPSADM